MSLRFLDSDTIRGSCFEVMDDDINVGRIEFRWDWPSPAWFFHPDGREDEAWFVWGREEDESAMLSQFSRLYYRRKMRSA